MTIIESIYLREILDSRGNPTIEAEIFTTSGYGRSAAPGGASVGLHEAKALSSRYAVENGIANVIPDLIGLDSSDQEGFDELLREIDGTSDFSQIGANLSVALSLANAKAAASSLKIPLFRYIGGLFAKELPYPLGNVIGGGAHASAATEIQEFLIVPEDASDIQEAVFTNASVHRQVRDLLNREKIPCGKGDEGAWAPQIDDIRAFELIIEAVGMVSDETNLTINIGIDMASSRLWNGEVYQYRDRARSPEDQISYIAELVDRYNLVYVEDPFHEEDFEAFAELTSQVSSHCHVCGDDLFVTNVERIMKGIELGSANCLVIKPNQIGTLTDTSEAIRLSQYHSLATVMSHRSGETTDTTIAHLATAFSCDYIKCGIVGGERIAKLNELIRIEEQI